MLHLLFWDQQDDPAERMMADQNWNKHWNIFSISKNSNKGDLIESLEVYRNLALGAKITKNEHRPVGVIPHTFFSHAKGITAGANERHLITLL